MAKKTIKTSKSFLIYFFLYFSVLLTLFFATGCGNQIKDTGSSSNQSVKPINSGSFDTGSLDNNYNFNTSFDNARECSNVIQNSSKAALVNSLEGLFFRSISNIELPATMCVDSLGSELTNFDAAIRFEYEDDVGIRSLDFTENELIYSSRKDNKIHLLFLDGAGYVEIKGTKGSTGEYTATVRIANLPTQSSYYDELNAWLDDLYDFCNTSPAKCVNVMYVPSQPNYYPSQTKVLEEAAIYLNGGRGADAYTLGTVHFTL